MRVFIEKNSYPFGMLVPGRSFTGNEYKYGFNGMEKDNELKGEGNAINYEKRFFDPRIGKFLSIDPLMEKFPELTPYQFASNTPIWAVDLDGLEARIYTDLSPLPHSFISVVDDDGIKHVYTFGQYGQDGWGIGPAFNSKGALVHLVGEDANNYINYEFKHMGDKMSVYEISDLAIDKNQMIDYFNSVLEKYSEPAEKIAPHAPIYANEVNGSSAVLYKPYWLIPDGELNENCTSVVNDALRAGNVNIDGIAPGTANNLAIPWTLNAKLWEYSLFYPEKVTNVTEDEKKSSIENFNSKDKPVIPLKTIEIKAVQKKDKKDSQDFQPVGITEKL